MKRILKSTGSIYLHCDPTASHYLKTLMDSVFGNRNFRNEITWCYKSGGVSKRYFARKHDTILFYSKSDSYRFNPLKVKSYGQTGGGQFGKVKYYKDRRGHYSLVNARDWWEISILATTHSERLGYPTQKPLALLERIIKASSNEGDLVLDPFCGCATTCIAAERLDRQWIGIDLSSMAVKLVEERARNDLGMMGGIQSIARKDIPKRTDLEPPPPLAQSKVTLYGTQAGNCNGCGTHFMQQHLTVDHIIAKTKGGTDHLENLQLLCGHCNSLKGNRPMEYLRARLVREFA